MVQRSVLFLVSVVGLLLVAIGVAACGTTAGGAQQIVPTPKTLATSVVTVQPAEHTAVVAQVVPSETPEPTSTPEPTVTATPTPTPSPTHTPTPTPTPAPVRFGVIGDFGMAGHMAEDVATLVKSWEPDFIVTTGDNNYPNGEAETMDINVGQYYHEYIYPYMGDYGSAEAEEQKTINRFFPSIGNHDLLADYGQPYYDYFTLPGNERYYHVTFDPVAIFVLNSMPGEEDGIRADSAQAAWLQQALAESEACWKVVVFHHPPYTSDHRGPYTWMRWPFAEWGADTVLNGHHHTYERLEVDGFPYFVNGLGGGVIYAFGDQPPESQIRYNEEYGAMLVEVTEQQMTLQFITRLDEVIDTYTIEKACSPKE